MLDYITNYYITSHHLCVQYLQPPNTMPPPSLFASPPRSSDSDVPPPPAKRSKSAKQQLDEAVANIPGFENEGDGVDLLGAAEEDITDTKPGVVACPQPKSYFSLLRDRFRAKPDCKVSSRLLMYIKFKK